MEFPDALITSLRNAQRIAVLTGAGISAESGIPTFREAQTGLWARYDPTELATPGAFRRNPALVWEWYAWRRKLIASASPNAGHLALAKMGKFVQDFTLITQNVDGLHQRAGSLNVVELHGNIGRTRCFEEGTTVEFGAGNEELPPRCPNCGGLLRPDVVWFNETLPPRALNLAFQAAEKAQIFFTIGTSAVVHPAATLPLHALHSGALLAEINPAPTPLTETVTHVLTGPAGEVLPQLAAEVWGL